MRLSPRCYPPGAARFAACSGPGPHQRTARPCLHWLSTGSTARPVQDERAKANVSGRLHSTSLRRHSDECGTIPRFFQGTFMPCAARLRDPAGAYARRGRHAVQPFLRGAGRATVRANGECWHTGPRTPGLACLAKVWKAPSGLTPQRSWPAPPLRIDPARLCAAIARLCEKGFSAICPATASGHRGRCRPWAPGRIHDRDGMPRPCCKGSWLRPAQPPLPTSDRFPQATKTHAA